MKLFKRGETPSWWVSLIPFVVLVAVLVVVIKVFGDGALDGASQVALLMATGVTVAISMIFYRVPWKEFEEGILDNIRAVGTSILILLLIGAVSGSWMISGVVPTMIYYGTKLIIPEVFLFAACGICALIAVMTGSSWTTIATVGVALVGIGTVQGYHPGWTAGAIISGAYFGDKISPLSDTTVLASSSAGTPLFTHIRCMLVTTIPSFVIALLVFLVVSLMHKPSGDMQAIEYINNLERTFTISPWLLLVPVVTGFLIVKKVPAMLTLFVAAVIAGLVALFVQPHIIQQIANEGSDVYHFPADSFTDLSFFDGFKGTFMTYYGPTAIETGDRKSVV